VGFGFATVTPSATSVAQVGAAAVWTYPQRSLTDIQSLAAAIKSNNPNLLSTLSDILYVPAPYFAGQVSATQVAAFLDNLALNYGMVEPVAAAITASPYGLWSTNFVTQVIPHMSATSLAQILFSSQVDPNHAQNILYVLAQNYYYNKWVYTITANAPSSITFSANATLSTNVLIAQNITIAPGVTVTCGTTTCLFVAQNFNNQGTIVNSYGANGGGGQAPGGNGGGGIVVVAISTVLGTLNVSGGAGSGGGSAATANAGSAGQGGVFYVTAGVAVPIGGTGGYSGGIAAHNGGGGGGGDGNGGGNGGNATVYSFSSPNAMVTYILQGIGDWWLANVAGKAPGSITPLAMLYGSGGGGGGANPGYGSGGGGGGGGGEIIVYGYDIVSGTINAVGGVGGSSVDSPAGGGGGGAGGLAFIFYGAASGSVTANVAGGAGGGGSTSSYNGAAGASGTAYIAKVTVNG
jgi:hypothetical protein